MCFEDEFMDKQSEIISLYKEAASAKSELLFPVFNCKCIPC